MLERYLHLALEFSLQGLELRDLREVYSADRLCSPCYSVPRKRAYVQEGVVRGLPAIRKQSMFNALTCLVQA